MSARRANDGTRGSGLYRVRIKLSRRPPRELAAALPDVWNHPPQLRGECPRSAHRDTAGCLTFVGTDAFAAARETVGASSELARKSA